MEPNITVISSVESRLYGFISDLVDILESPAVYNIATAYGALETSIIQVLLDLKSRCVSENCDLESMVEQILSSKKYERYVLIERIQEWVPERMSRLRWSIRRFDDMMEKGCRPPNSMRCRLESLNDGIWPSFLDATCIHVADEFETHWCNPFYSEKRLEKVLAIYTQPSCFEENGILLARIVTNWPQCFSSEQQLRLKHKFYDAFRMNMFRCEDKIQSEENLRVAASLASNIDANRHKYVEDMLVSQFYERTHQFEILRDSWDLQSILTYKKHLSMLYVTNYQRSDRLICVAYRTLNIIAYGMCLARKHGLRADPYTIAFEDLAKLLADKVSNPPGPGFFVGSELGSIDWCQNIFRETRRYATLEYIKTDIESRFDILTKDRGYSIQAQDLFKLLNFIQRMEEQASDEVNRLLAQFIFDFTQRFRLGICIEPTCDMVIMPSVHVLHIIEQLSGIKYDLGWAIRTLDHTNYYWSSGDRSFMIDCSWPDFTEPTCREQPSGSVKSLLSLACMAYLKCADLVGELYPDDQEIVAAIIERTIHYENPVYNVERIKRIFARRSRLTGYTPMRCGGMLRELIINWPKNLSSKQALDLKKRIYEEKEPFLTHFSWSDRLIFMTKNLDKLQIGITRETLMDIESILCEHAFQPSECIKMNNRYSIIQSQAIVTICEPANQRVLERFNPRLKSITYQTLSSLANAMWLARKRRIYGDPYTIAFRELAKVVAEPGFGFAKALVVNNLQSADRCRELFEETRTAAWVEYFKYELLIITQKHADIIMKPRYGAIVNN